MVRERLVLTVLLAGNFVVATCAILPMALVPDLSHALQADPAAVGQLVTLSGVVMCVVAPLAGSVGWRIGLARLLVLALLVQGLALLLSSVQTSLTGLMLTRAVQVLGPAVFTAQAAALLPALVPLQNLGRATAVIYLGWPLALVLGMPAASWLSGAWGWIWVFFVLGVLSLAVAGAVARVLPAQARDARRADDAPACANPPGLWMCLSTTALASAAQLMLLTYFTSYGRHVLHADHVDLALALGCLGVLGTLGVSLVGRLVDRIGAARAALLCLSMMLASMLAWPWATTLVWSLVVLSPWALAAFALNAVQQARLIAMDATAAPRTVGLNTSFVYLGQGLGAAMGGYWVQTQGFDTLGWGAALLLALAMMASLRGSRLAALAKA